MSTSQLSKVQRRGLKQKMTIFKNVQKRADWFFAREDVSWMQWCSFLCLCRPLVIRFSSTAICSFCFSSHSATRLLHVSIFYPGINHALPCFLLSLCFSPFSQAHSSQLTVDAGHANTPSPTSHQYNPSSLPGGLANTDPCNRRFGSEHTKIETQTGMVGFRVMCG